MASDQLVEVFRDTEEWYQENPKLAAAVQKSIEGTKLYKASDYPQVPVPHKESNAAIRVSKSRTFEAAMRLLRENPGKKVTVHNFASATNPGGGVTRGSRAQEESQCRCSTLYPVLNTPELKRNYYNFHRNLHDTRYTDACIYSPGILIIKSDTSYPERLPESNWQMVDVMTCAAPNLRARPYNRMNPGSGTPIQVSDEELLELHKSRAKHMLTIAAAHGADILVLGAFGCGAFQNKPEIVAEAYREVLPAFARNFQHIEFAVYTSRYDSGNFDAFREKLSEK